MELKSPTGPIEHVSNTYLGDHSRESQDLRNLIPQVSNADLENRQSKDAPSEQTRQPVSAENAGRNARSD